MTTWTNELTKDGGVSEGWGSSTATWGSSVYEWDGQTATIWVNETIS